MAYFPSTDSDADAASRCFQQPPRHESYAHPRKFQTYFQTITRISLLTPVSARNDGEALTSSREAPLDVAQSKRVPISACPPTQRNSEQHTRRGEVVRCREWMARVIGSFVALIRAAESDAWFDLDMYTPDS